MCRDLSSYRRRFRSVRAGLLRSKGAGPWPAGQTATTTTEIEGQEMVFLRSQRASPNVSR
jgi:hypothetical protein